MRALCLRILTLAACSCALLSCGSDGCEPSFTEKNVARSITGHYYNPQCTVYLNDEMLIEDSKGELSINYESDNKVCVGFPLKINTVEYRRSFHIKAGGVQVTGLPYDARIDHQGMADVTVGEDQERAPISISGEVWEMYVREIRYEDTRCDPLVPMYMCDLRVELEMPEGTYRVEMKSEIDSPSQFPPNVDKHEEMQ